MNRLNGRIARLEEAAAEKRGPDHCRRCHLRHVEPLTISLIRSVLRVAGGSDLQMERPVLLCLCEPCCTAGRWLARCSHGLSADGSAV